MKCLNIQHIGVWVHVDDIDEMLSFLTEGLGFSLMTRTPIGERMERIFVHAGDNQTFELLTGPNVQPRPDFPVHPIGQVGGIPHICLRVDDIHNLEEKIKSLGYPITQKVEETSFELGTAHVIWFTGPCGVGFEIFKYKEEYPFEKFLTNEKQE